MDYKKVYTREYFSGKNSFFYSLGYGRFLQIPLNSLYRPLRPYVEKIQHGKVLDVGCAYGFMLQRFPDTFEKFGIDVSEYAIKEAKQRNPEATFCVCGAEDKYPLKENSFDIVIANDLLEHLMNPRAALDNMRSVLKEGGILYINTPNLNWFRKKVFAYADKKEHHISLFPHRELLDLLVEVGFTVVDHWTYTNLTYFFFPKFRSNIGIEQAFICKK